MSTKHTPGPWIYDGKSRDIVRNADGTLIAQLYKIHADTLVADARLIAAAPELLEALKFISKELWKQNIRADLYAKARAAIAKAEGKE